MPTSSALSESDRLMVIGPADDSGRLKESGRAADSGRPMVTGPDLSWSGGLMEMWQWPTELHEGNVSMYSGVAIL